MTSTRYRTEVEFAAGARGLDPDLIEAVVLKESSGDPWAWNPEPRYRYFWDVKKHQPFRRLVLAEGQSEIPPDDFRALAGDPDQEWWGQQASWGLMQIMGAVAREQGFEAPYLPALCQVDVNLRHGCLHLSRHLEWAGGEIVKALAAYNGGRGGWSNPVPLAYAKAVDGILMRVKKARRL